MTAPQADQPAESSSGGGMAKGITGFLFAIVLLLVLAMGVLVTATLASPWPWIIVFGALLLGFPLLARILVREKFRNLVFILYGMVAAGLVVGSLVQIALAVILPPPGEGDVPLALVGGLIAGLMAALAVPLILRLLVGLSSHAVLGMHEWEGISPRDASDFLWSSLVGTNQPWAVVENGEVVGGKKQGIFHTLGGPGLVVVRPGNAVVLQRTGEISQIVGPGRHRVRRHEKIRRMVQLGPLWETRIAENVLTRDGAPLTITLGVGYGIESKEDTDRRAGPPPNPQVIEGDYPVYEDTIRKAVLNVTPAGWQLSACAGCESQLRDIIGTYTLDELFEMETVERTAARGGEFHESRRVIKRVEERVLDNFAKIAAPSFGIKIRVVDIQSVQVPDQVKEQMLETWSAVWKQRIAREKLRLEADNREMVARAFRLMEGIKMASQKKVLEQVMEAVTHGHELLGTEHFDKYLELISKLATEMAKDTTTALRFSDSLEKLFQNPEARIVLAPPDAAVRAGRRDVDNS